MILLNPEVEKNKKSVEPNSIRTFLLKHFKKELSIPTCIDNKFILQNWNLSKSLQNCECYPNLKKVWTRRVQKLQAHIITLQHWENNRKMSALSIIWFLDKTKYQYKKQFGFRNVHCTNHALIIINEKNKNNTR